MHPNHPARASVADFLRDEAELLRERAKAVAIAEIRAILIDLRNACAEAEDEGYITADEAAGIADVCAEWDCYERV